VKVTHLKTGTVLGRQVKAATTFGTRLRGFMFRASPAPYDGLFIPWSNSVHNCFVRFPLDVIFLGRDHSIKKILRGFRPWRFSWIYFSAAHVLELPAGALPEEAAPGDRLQLEE
jgi:uncharacterized membrane protein (UPF0127 family)